MDFVVVSGLFALFLVGLVLVIQGIIGKEIYPPDGMPFVGWKLGPRAIQHPPERHPVRLVLIGVGLMVLAVVVGAFAI